MLYQKRNELVFLQSELLLAHGFDKHAFFLKGEDSLSFDNSCITTSEKRVKETFSLAHLVYPVQVHGTKLYCVSTEDMLVGEGDGMVTDQEGLGLLVRHADCQAALIVDPKKRVAMALHVGWRGSVANFFKIAFLQMQHQYGSQPQDCLVAISPSLGPDHAEFKGYQEYFPASFSAVMIRNSYFDLWQLSCLQLQALGVKLAHIDIANVCTYEASSQCYSYRRLGKADPRRHGSFISI